MSVNTEEFCRSVDVPQRLPNLFTENQWAWAFRNRRSNGLDRAVKRIGSRYFVNVSTLLEVLERSSD